MAGAYRFAFRQLYLAVAVESPAPSYLSEPDRITVWEANKLKSRGVPLLRPDWLIGS